MQRLPRPEKWIGKAKRLAWCGKVHLARANGRGRAAEPELASVGARCGQVMLVEIKRQTIRLISTQQSELRRLPMRLQRPVELDGALAAQQPEDPAPSR